MPNNDDATGCVGGKPHSWMPLSLHGDHVSYVWCAVCGARPDLNPQARTQHVSPQHVLRHSHCKFASTGQHTWKQTDCNPSFTYCSSCGFYAADPTPSRVEARPSWAETWMTVARTIGARSYDPRLKVGAIIVSFDNTQVLSVGYNGSYRGGPHEHESSEPGRSGFIHAEVNALVKCDFNFGKRKRMYVTHSPCRDCSKLIINAELAELVYDVPYRDASGLELLRGAGVVVRSMAEALAQEAG